MVPIFAHKVNGTPPDPPASGDDAIEQVTSLDMQEAAYTVPLEQDRNVCEPGMDIIDSRWEELGQPSLGPRPYAGKKKAYHVMS